ncbi:HAD family hydrolase [Marivita hallyeonensis]|uniref:Putative hydrolase of the HAD superfamily n=1 Tax=Marivita hallyeonensis TaxID=996342 RepID=A0A1M5MDP6_9RHOB|nr:HAD family hydrolase [Marivita hallyeonensis]SHG75524.1 putative hydrolase of the HAD superfamily [Marivita hallyeonensis]
MVRKLTTIGFDADDTLWHNERFFKLTQARFEELLSDYTDASVLHDRLLEAERRNIGHYGFGVKGFVLSMIETAIDVTEGQVPGHVIRHILDAGQEMLAHPIELLPHAAETVATLAGHYRIVLITKGDLLHQERKLAQSGLGELFDDVAIVSEKSVQTYRTAFAAEHGGPERAMMVGNSMRSDIVPAVEAGSWGVHVPHDLEWDLEHASAPESPRFQTIQDLGELPALVAKIG